MTSARIVSVGGILAAMTAVVVLQLQAETELAQRVDPKHGSDMQLCAKVCAECQRACDECATHCLQLVAQGMKEHTKTVLSCQDCADLCAAAAKITARGGPFADLVCKSCADACARCAQACSAMPQDKVMRACADECRKCETTCREMVKNTSQAHNSAK